MSDEPTAPADVNAYWVVIPAYNEAATIREIVTRTLHHMTHVVVVDDGSTDGTAEAVLDMPVTVLRNPTNRGKGASLWRGFQRALDAGACGVITLDGDGQHAPEEIQKLVSAAISSPEYFIIGARRRDQRRAVFWRYFANRVADFWISWASGTPLDDSQSGFRLYPANLLRAAKIKHTPSRGFVFESEILIEAARSGFRIATVSINVLRRLGARPSYFRPVLDIVRITKMVGWKLLSKGMYLGGLYRSLLIPEATKQIADRTTELESRTGIAEPRGGVKRVLHNK